MDSKSSITTIFFLSADISTLLIEVVYLIIGIGKALSMKMRTTTPFERATIRDSRLGGPEITRTNLIGASITHSRTRMSEKARS